MLPLMTFKFKPEEDLDGMKTNQDVINELVQTVSSNGNFLLNIGPTKYGTIPPIAQERLKTMGEFLRTNGEAIYGSKYWTVPNDNISPTTWYVLHMKTFL